MLDCGSTTGLVSRTQDTELLQLESQEPVRKFENKVPHIVVSRNSVTGLLAAKAMIAK